MKTLIANLIILVRNVIGSLLLLEEDPEPYIEWKGWHDE